MSEKNDSGGPEGSEYVGEVVGIMRDADGTPLAIAHAGSAYAEPHVAEVIAHERNKPGNESASVHLSMSKKFAEGYEAIFGKKDESVTEIPAKKGFTTEPSAN